jgi:D-tyrosyl-tRNA(Tyr) deacylase
MRALLQRVAYAKIKTDDGFCSTIKSGILVFVGFEETDDAEDLILIKNKIFNLRIFQNPEGKLHYSITDTQADLMIVSQFTLFADSWQGNRPSFTRAAKPEQANTLYNQFYTLCQSMPNTCCTGKFGSHMQIELINDGPLTIWLDSKSR